MLMTSQKYRLKKFSTKAKINLMGSSTNFWKVSMRKNARNVIRLFMPHL